MQTISEATAIRLFNSVVAGAPNGMSNNASGETPLIIPPVVVEKRNSVESVQSSNDFGSSCRICRWNRSDMEVSPCPCLCKGSVGFIHLQCLKRWILHRHDNRCEICNVPFELPREKLNIPHMMKTFMCSKCMGVIIKHLLFSSSLIPLAHVVLQQVLICMENINQNDAEDIGAADVIVASCALLTSSALFFHYFEFITTRLLLIRNVLRQWWYFGNSSEYSLVEINSDSLDMF